MKFVVGRSLAERVVVVWLVVAAMVRLRSEAKSVICSLRIAVEAGVAETAACAELDSLCHRVHARVLLFASLCTAVLCIAVLCCALLCIAVLCCAVLCCAVLCCAVLCCAVLCCAVLCFSSLAFSACVFLWWLLWPAISQPSVEFEAVLRRTAGDLLSTEFSHHGQVYDQQTADGSVGTVQ